MKDTPDWMISEIVAGDICMVVKNAGLPEFDYLLGTLVRVVSVEPNGRFSDPTILPIYYVDRGVIVYTAMLRTEPVIPDSDVNWNVIFVREELKKMEPLTSDELLQEMTDNIADIFASIGGI